MRLNTILVPFTVAMLVYTAYMVFEEVQKRSGNDSTEPTTETSELTIPSSERSLLTESESLFVTGVSSKIPIREDYHLLPSVPWELKDLSRLFREAGEVSACALMEAGTQVVQPLLIPKENTPGILGRRSAFSIRLQVGAELGGNLKNVIRGAVEGYLKEHLLTIQPLFYCSETGKVVMSPEVRAAFVRLDSPESSTVAEPMIASSIRELRTLGTYWTSPEEFRPEMCRTMILGFRYTLETGNGVAKATAQREYELVILHLLPDATARNPKLAVFATSDARTQFHLLEESNPDSPEQSAAITADVRFADSKLMGMYPEAPVVTGVHHRALLSIPVDVVQTQLAGINGSPPPGGLSDVLDELYKRAIMESEQSSPTEEPAPPEQTAPTKDAASLRPDNGPEPIFPGFHSRIQQALTGEPEFNLNAHVSGQHQSNADAVTAVSAYDEP